MRFLKWILFSLILVLLVSVSFASWVYTTESGLQWVWHQLQQHKPPELTVAKLSGKLNDKLLIKNIQWQQADLTVQIDQAAIECQWIDLIFKQVNCAKLSTPTVTVKNHPSQTVVSKDTGNAQLTNLPQFSLPLVINIKAIEIAQVDLQSFSSEQKLLDSNSVKNIQLKQLSYRHSAFVWTGLTFDFKQYKLQLAGSFKPDQDWQHQFSLNAKGPELSVNFVSSGKINRQAHFKIDSLQPFIARLEGNWHWNKGLFINNANAQANHQTIDVADLKITLNKLSSSFELNWPILSLDSAFNASWQQFENIEFNNKATIEDITSWQNSASLEIAISGILSDKVIKQKLNSLVTENSLPVSSAKNWPISGTLKSSISDGKINTESNNIKIGDLAVKFDGEMQLNHDRLDAVVLQAELKATALEALTGFPIAGVTTTAKYTLHKNVWTLNTEGTIKTIQHPELAMTDLYWSVNLDQQWKAIIRAKNLHMAQSEFAEATLNLSGSADKHNLSLTAKPGAAGIKGLISKTPLKNSQQFSLQLQGQLDMQKASAAGGTSTQRWIINDAKANVPLENANLSIKASGIKLKSDGQKVDQLCLKTIDLVNANSANGEICLSADYSQQDWQASFQFDRWMLKPAYQISKNYRDALPLDLVGAITGKGRVAGNATELTQLDLDLLLPELQVKTDEGELTWQQLSVKSVAQNKNIRVKAEWQTQKSSLISANWQSDLTMPSGQLQLTLSDGELETLSLNQQNINWILPYSNDSEQRHSLLFPTLSVNSSLDNEQLDSHIKLDLLEDDHIVTNIRTDWPVTADSKIKGDIDILISHLDWLKQWQKSIDNLDIQFVQKAGFSGTWNAPLIKGQGDLVINQLSIEELGVDIKDSHISLTNQNQQLAIQGLVKNQAGELKLSGSALLYPELSADIAIDGSNITLVSDQNNKVVITPRINAKYSNNLLNVDGKVIFDQARIKISALPKQAIRVSEDQNIVGAKAKKTNLLNYNIQLDLVAGPEVHLEGFGLTSGLTGSLKASAQSGKPPLLNGRLNLKDGKFEAYKQQLVIEEGQLLFLGSMDNPGIQFRAVRKIDDIKVGIVADGSIANPRLTLYSTPAMAEENILALLLTGRSIESLSQSEGNALANAAIGLGVDGANILVQKIGSALGIKNMSISSKTRADSTRVDIGAKINDRLNVGYATTIDSNNEMQAGWLIEYIISSSISIEAISGEEVSTSISYKKQLNGSSAKEKKKEDNKNN